MLAFKSNVFIILKYKFFIPNHENFTIFAIWSFNLDALRLDVRVANLNARSRKALFKLNDMVNYTDSFERKVKLNDKTKRMNMNGNFHGTREFGEFE